MEKAIKISIENGYVKEEFFANNEDVVIADLEKKIVTLDPLFWQALGRGLGWSEESPGAFDYGERIRWEYEWHRFIDHLIEGKSIDLFFESLLQ